MGYRREIINMEVETQDMEIRQDMDHRALGVKT